MYWHGGLECDRPVCAPGRHALTSASGAWREWVSKGEKSKQRLRSIEKISRMDNDVAMCLVAPSDPSISTRDRQRRRRRQERANNPRQPKPGADHPIWGGRSIAWLSTVGPSRVTPPRTRQPPGDSMDWVAWGPQYPKKTRPPNRIQDDVSSAPSSRPSWLVGRPRSSVSTTSSLASRRRAEWRDALGYADSRLDGLEDRPPAGGAAGGTDHRGTDFARSAFT